MMCAVCGLRFLHWHTCPGYLSGTVVMPKVQLPPGYVPPSAAVGTPIPDFDVRRLEEAIRAALDELGVPGPDYPAPVATAVGFLRRALDGTVSAVPVDAPAYTGEAPGTAELLSALVCLQYLGRLGDKRCGECPPCLMAARIGGA